MKAHWVLVAVLAFAIALILILASPALANGDGQTRYACPGGGYTFDPNWAAAGCGQPTQPSPQPGGDATGVGVGVGIGTGVGVGTGGAGGAGGQGGAGGDATATGGTSFGSTATARIGGVTVNSNSRAAAASAIAPQLGGYGLPNCFGDTNPSGSFTAAWQAFGFGAASGSMKASNICAVYAIGGEAAAIGYLQRMDPNMPRRVTVTQPTGRVVCPASHPVYVEGRGCRK